MEDIAKVTDLTYQKLRLCKFFNQNNIYSYNIKQANSNYYDLTLDQRKEFLGSNIKDNLCKTIILENKNFDESKESKFYKRYYMCIVQYINEFNAEKIAKLLKKRQNDNCEEKLSNKYFHFRLSKDEVAFEMTGYYFNCITPYLMKSDSIEILFPDVLLNVYPYYLWLGGGEIELKVGISIFDFINLYKSKIIIGDILS